MVKSFNVLTILALALCSNFSKCDEEGEVSGHTFFPKYIPKFLVRRDIYTNETVSRGRLELIDENPLSWNIEHTSNNRVTYREFKKRLQCAPNEPDINSQHGGISIMKYVKMTKESLELACAWVESGCQPWPTCRPLVDKYKSGTYQNGNLMAFQGTSIKLVRIINGQLYGDWPWGQEREEVDWTVDNNPHMAIVHFVVRSISDWKNNLFFIGEESSNIDYNFPFPALSEAPKLGKNDFPLPWHKSIQSQIERYRRSLKSNNFTDAFYLRGENSDSPEHSAWATRIPKAAFFATISESGSRNIVFDQAILRPDLFDAHFGNKDEITSWNPSAKEHKVKVTTHYKPKQNSTFGEADYIYPLMGEHRYNPAHYKYVIVTLGGGGLPADRFENILAYSGAVVLFQESAYTYHFSSRLQPWVHYVPLAYNMADLIEKVEWLQAHDDLAQQIAANALAFGKSHLRLEDQYCYLATAFKSIESVVYDTDAITPWKPWKFS